MGSHNYTLYIVFVSSFLQLLDFLTFSHFELLMSAIFVIWVQGRKKKEWQTMQILMNSTQFEKIMQ